MWSGALTWFQLAFRGSWENGCISMGRLDWQGANPGLSRWIHTFPRLKPSFLGRKSLFLWLIHLILKNPCVAQEKIDSRISRYFQDVCLPSIFQVSNFSFWGPTPRHRSTRRTPPGYCHQRPASRRPCPPGVKKIFTWFINRGYTIYIHLSRET